MNKASGGDGISAELFQILKDDAVKVLHSICQPIWNQSAVACLVSQEAGKVVWYSHLFKIFPQFVVIHTVKALA